ncbi:MAG: YfiR family protein [Cyclobacteriaceae bacterium]
MLLINILGIAFQGNAQNYQLHAVFMYSFMKYIQWPSNADNFTITVLGSESEIIPHLKSMSEEKTLNGRAIQLKVTDSPIEIGPSDIVFLSRKWSEQENIVESWALKAREEKFLLLTDQAPAKGTSHINFIEENKKLLFELNRKRIELAGLRVSTELLALAKIVE